jgi:hypothetical protein
MMKALAWTHHKIAIAHQMSRENTIIHRRCNDLLRRLRCSKNFYSQSSFVATHQSSSDPNANTASQRLAQRRKRRNKGFPQESTWPRPEHQLKRAPIVK